MNVKKFVAGILACCVVGGALPFVDWTVDKPVITASAAEGEDYTEGTYESLTYRKYVDYIEISGCDQSATSVVIPAEIDGVPVTSIGNGAFVFCNELIQLTIPDSVTGVNKGAFCFNAWTTIPWIDAKREENPLIIINGILIDGQTCSDDVVISNNVTSIGGGAFEDCSSLTKITIPDNVTSIGAMAFYACMGLEEITILNPDCEIEDAETTFSNNNYVMTADNYFNGTIYGYDNSTAQKYAEKYGRKFVCLDAAPEKEAEMGDIDGDGIIDSSDASLVLAEYSLLSTGKNSTLSESQKKLADLNKDETIDASDASLILAYYSHAATGGTDSIDVFLKKQGY